MDSFFYTDIPTWIDGVETTTSFQSRDDFRLFVLSVFKEEGPDVGYQFDETSLFFNEEGRKLRRLSYYCDAPKMSKDYLNYWKNQAIKCRKGMIFRNKDKIWYLPRFYYMWLNFLPIYDKVKRKHDFPEVWDSQYHAALYIHLAELHWKHATTLKKRQWGGEQPHSEPVLSISGWTTMGEIQVGDKLWNPDGTSQTITHKFNQGAKDVYEFEFSDGRKTKVGIDHNWELYDRQAKKIKILNTKQILEFPLFNIVSAPTKAGKKEYKGYRFGIKNINAIPFSKKELPFDPYLLGYMLGNGSFGKVLSVTSNDREIDEIFRNILGDKYLLTLNSKTRNCYRYNLTYLDRFAHEDEKYGINPLIRIFTHLGLMGTSCYNKFIPEIYLNSSIEDRLSLLRGLNDSDGYINERGQDIHYTTVSSRLAKDVEYLCRSLGLSCRVDKKDKQAETHQDFYRVRICGTIPFNIFRLERKLKRQEKRKQGLDLSNIISIKKLDYKEESSCIVVDNPNHLYITKDFIVTHNSFLHTAILINEIWFEQGPVLKIGASLKDYVNEKGSWRFLEEYRSFLDGNTAWYRPMNPGKVGIWQQQIDIKIGNRKSKKGFKGVLQMTTFEKDPTNGVGGGIRWFYHEEFGIAPKADVTLEYLLPALKSGDLTTGTFAGSGSVGDLDQCEPLKNCLLNPDANDMFAVETALLDDKGTRGKTALFIPEQWSMPPYIDQYGNSLVPKALEAIDTQRLIWKKDLSAELYQLRISQHPKNIYEAFAYRKESIFPLNLIQAQKRRIDEKLYPCEYLDIDLDEQGKLVFKKSHKLPIREFPLNKATDDKEGVIEIWERPFKDSPDVGKYYYASIDPVGEGRTVTSQSLVSIIIWKLDVEVTKYSQDTETYIEHGKIVATWCGRFDDLNKTHERLQHMIEMYGAWTLCENNISAFITHMINKKKQHYLVPKTQIMFLRDLGINETVFSEYGWKNTGNLFRGHLLSQGIESLKEELDAEVLPNGVKVKTVFGIERIPDIMLLTEMEAYQPGMNVDRLVAYCALMAFIKVQQANRGFVRRVEKDDSAKLADKKLYVKENSFFKTKKPSLDPQYNVKKTGFRNLK